MNCRMTGGADTANAAENSLLPIVVKLPHLMRVEVATIGRCCTTVTTSRLGIYKYLLPNCGPRPSF
jgi:hypothetical protein